MLLPALPEVTRRRTGTLAVTHAVRRFGGSSFAQPVTAWAKASLYGFYIENNIRDMHITTASAKDDRIGENNMVGRRVHVTGAMGDNVLIEVDHIRHATFAPKQLEKRGNGVFMG